MTSRKTASATGETIRILCCPTCGRRFARDSSTVAPFCSERCKLVDLGRWLDGSYRLAGEPADFTDNPEDGEDPNEN